MTKAANFLMSISARFLLTLCLGAGCFYTSCKPSSNPQNSTVAGQTSADHTSPVQATADTTHLIGVWLDQDLTWQKNQRVAYEIISKGQKTYIQVITFSGKKLNVSDSPELSSTAAEITKSGDKYISKELPKAVYTFDKNGDMQVFDENGLVMKCKRAL